MTAPSSATNEAMPAGHVETRNKLFPVYRLPAQYSGMSANIAEPGRNLDSPAAPKIGVIGCERTAVNDRRMIDALRRSKLYRDYERAFMDATGLPLALRPFQFFGLPLHGNKNENPFCAFLAEREHRCSLCLQTQARITALSGNMPRSIQCRYGLTETVVPIVLGERVIGFLCTGQVFTHRWKSGSLNPEIRFCLKGSDLPGEALELWHQTRHVEAIQYKATIQLLSFFAKQLSALSNQLVIEGQACEPAVVARARQFVESNKRERITLAAVAKAAGASMFHFCTLFHQSTGLKLSEYIARRRVEDARSLLCNRGLRISEIAFEAGFGSVATFNRAFRRVVGQSPSQYRHGLLLSKTRYTASFCGRSRDLLHRGRRRCCAGRVKHQSRAAGSSRAREAASLSEMSAYKLGKYRRERNV